MSKEFLQPKSRQNDAANTRENTDLAPAKTMAPPPFQLKAEGTGEPKKEEPTKDEPKKEDGQQANEQEGPAKGNPLLESAPKEERATEAASEEPAELAKKGETPIRKAMFEQFKAFKGAKVGDEQFDQVVTQEEWDKTKGKEDAQAIANQKQYEKDVETFPQRLVDYDAAMVKYKADSAQYKIDWQNYLKELGGWNSKSGAPRPVMPIKPKEPKKPMKPMLAKVPIFTTCIATQGKILKNALDAIGMNLKTIDGKITHPAFATDGKERAQKLGGWHEAKPGMTERPNPGDILIFSMRGSEVDNAASSLAYGQGTMSVDAQSVKKLEKSLGALKAQITALDGTKKAAAEEKMTEMSAQLEAAKAKYEAYVQKLQEKLDALRSQALAQPDKLWFSHVSMLQKISKRTEPDGKVYDPQRENWLTFDGGQKVDGIEGANDSNRVYDPKTTEISGEAQQGGAARFLKGWVDVDKLVGAEKKKKK